MHYQLLVFVTKKYYFQGRVRYPLQFSQLKYHFQWWPTRQPLKLIFRSGCRTIPASYKVRQHAHPWGGSRPHPLMEIHLQLRWPQKQAKGVLYRAIAEHHQPPYLHHSTTVNVYSPIDDRCPNHTIVAQDQREPQHRNMFLRQYDTSQNKIQYRSINLLKWVTGGTDRVSSPTDADLDACE